MHNSSHFYIFLKKILIKRDLLDKINKPISTIFYNSKYIILLCTYDMLII